MNELYHGIFILSGRKFKAQLVIWSGTEIQIIHVCVYWRDYSDSFASVSVDAVSARCWSHTKLQEPVCRSIRNRRGRSSASMAESVHSKPAWEQCISFWLKMIYYLKYCQVNMVVVPCVRLFVVIVVKIFVVGVRRIRDMCTLRRR